VGGCGWELRPRRFNACWCRVTSLARKRTPLGPFRRPMPRVLGGWTFSYGRGTPVQRSGDRRGVYMCVNAEVFQTRLFLAPRDSPCAHQMRCLWVSREIHLRVLSESPNSVLITLRPYMPLEPRYPQCRVLLASLGAGRLREAQKCGTAGVPRKKTQLEGVGPPSKTTVSKPKTTVS